MVSDRISVNYMLKPLVVELKLELIIEKSERTISGDKNVIPMRKSSTGRQDYKGYIILLILILFQYPDTIYQVVFYAYLLLWRSFLKSFGRSHYR